MTKLTAEEQIDHAVSRNAIQNCLARYCRAIDRRDRVMLQTVYWPDATDDHVNYKGTASGFIDWVLPLLQQLELTQHFLGQTLIDQDGDSAAVETYFHAYHRMVLPPGLSDVILGGRYVDRFERRGGEWRISFRMVVGDYHKSQLSDGSLANFVLGAFPPNYAGVAGPADASIGLLSGGWPL